MADADAEREAFAEKLFQSSLGYFDLLSIRLGQRLGLYEVLAGGPVTSQELASRAGIAERYAREWLEQQTTAQIIAADIERDPVSFTLPAGHAEVLLDNRSSSRTWAPPPKSNAQPPCNITTAGPTRWSRNPSTYLKRRRSIINSLQGQTQQCRRAGAGNRPVFLTTLPSDWLPNVSPLHERLRADPPARVVDVGCGTGWSSIAIAKAYPKVTVDGIDPDEISIELARKNAVAEGVAHRVQFHRQNAADIKGATFDVATAFECRDM